MENEAYETWKPLPDVPDSLDYQSLKDTARGLEIELVDPQRGRVLRVFFRLPIAIRAMDERFRTRTWRSLGVAGLRASSFMIVKQSRWLRSILEESDGLMEDPVQHFAIFTSDDCIDVLARQSPWVEWISAE